MLPFLPLPKYSHPTQLTLVPSGKNISGSDRPSNAAAVGVSLVPCSTNRFRVLRVILATSVSTAAEQQLLKSRQRVIMLSNFDIKLANFIAPDDVRSHFPSLGREKEPISKEHLLGCRTCSKSSVTLSSQS